MPSSPVEFRKIEDWTNAFSGGVNWTHKKIDEMDSCLEEIRLIHTESLAVPGLQRPPKWQELGENVIKFNTLRNDVVDLVNTAFDALNTYWENNDESYTYMYMEAKPLRRRFEKTADAFDAQHRAFHEKAREKVVKHLAGNVPPGLARRPADGHNTAQQDRFTVDHPTNSAALSPASNAERPTHNSYMAAASDKNTSATECDVEDGQNVPKTKKPSPKGFVCDVCAKKLGSLQGLNDHKKDAHGVPIKPPPSAPKHVMDEYHRQLGMYCQQQMDKLQTN